MAQLAPVNWIYAFCMLWFCVILVVSLLWWGFSPVYGAFVSKVGFEGNRDVGEAEKSVGGEEGSVSWLW
uniref:ATP synthase F0 subunit 8 n=1 Tax=Diodora graeca TaxID=120387 RepID=A0A0X9RBN3_DIOGA|nr:ATP synthase F0 subunit 8 [Diodora graeca]